MAAWTNGTVFAESDRNGVQIKNGWNVGIPKSDCINFIQTLNTNALRGFYRTGPNNVVLSHGTASISLPSAAAQALVDLMVEQFAIQGGPYTV